MLSILFGVPHTFGIRIVGNNATRVEHHSLSIAYRGRHS